MVKEISPLSERGVCDNPRNTKNSLMLALGKIQILNSDKQILQIRDALSELHYLFNIMREALMRDIRESGLFLCIWMHRQLWQ